LKIDKKALDDAAADLGVEVQYDTETGNILNREATERALDEFRKKEYKKLAAGGWTKKEEERWDDINNKIKNYQNAASKYVDTQKVIQEKENDIQDREFQIQDNNAEILSYTLELKLELNEEDLRKIEYQLSALD
jgi:hypothetical protein